MHPLRSLTLAAALAATHMSFGSASAQRSSAPPTAADSAAAFADPGAAALFGRARAARLHTDHSIRSYTAVVRSRIAAALRMPLKDRTLFRQETAARVRWSRDAASVVQVLAARTQHPGGVEAPSSLSGVGIDELFDPGADRMSFGLRFDDDEADDDDDFWIEHPLGIAAERHYRYASGDTLTVRLQGGRMVRAIELLVTPRRDDPHTVRGTLWIDAESGALVQAAYRLARTVDILRDTDAVDDDDRDDIAKIPGFLKPFEFDITLMTVEYSLWEMEHWLPRTARFEGYGRAGLLRFPASTDMSYEMLDVEIDPPVHAYESVPERTLEDSVRAYRAESEAARRTAAEWGVSDGMRMAERKHNGRDVLLIMPADSMELLRSADLPPPIWSDAAGFATRTELDDLADRLASLGGTAPRDVRTHFGWGLGEADMLRYNRVEALSIGARFAATLPQADVETTVRLGIGDLHPNVGIALRRATARRTLELRGYHELTTTDPSGSALGLGNSLSALMFGRDAGEYYRASGAAFTWAPPAARRRTWDVMAYAEYQNDVARNTHISLPRVWTDSVFRPNIAAAEAMQYGGMLRLRPWWGSDPIRPQFGFDMMLQGETGDYDLARASVTLRAAAQLSRTIRMGAEAGIGSSTGEVTPQRMFYLGGAQTLRGYAPGSVAGTSMARSRIEMARTVSFGGVAVFSDWGWAGDRDEFRGADQRWAVGAGASLLDGLLRIDLAHGLRSPRGWRLDLHLDSVL